MPDVLVAQISDLHLRAHGLHFGLIDTTERARQAMAFLHGLARRPDLVLATGDLTDKGEPEAYAQLRDIVDASEIPVFLLPGNHDERDALVAAFPHHAYLPDPTGPLHYAVEEAGLRIVAVDTTVVDHQHGEFDRAAEAWLDIALAASPDQPTVLALHHPPFETGIWWMDQICLHGAERVEAVVRRHRQVRLVVAGHQHRPVQTAWGDTLVSVAPSTGLEVGCDLEVEGDPQFTTEAPQVALHLVNERRAVTHHAPFLSPDHVMRYSDQGDWDRLKATLRDRPPLPKGGMLG